MRHLEIGKICLLAVVACSNTTYAFADVASDHGLDELIERLGVGNEPTGLGVVVGQVEAPSNNNYAPDENEASFVGKTFILQSRW